jgi:alpha-mannosidase
LAEANVLRNEHCEVTLNPVTGAIKSVYTVNSRRNRLAQQLAFRLPQSRPEAGSTWSDPDDAAVYSTMACDELKVLANGPGCGRLQCRGSRILWIEIELELDELPRADPWNSYYAARFAWSDDVGELARGVGGVTQPTTGKRIEAPQFIELRAAGWQTTLLTGGLPYHLHTNDRMLDTLLVVRGESRRRFRLGVGFDSGNSSADALAVQGPSISVADVPLPAASSGQGWLLKVEARNAVATGLEAVTLDDGASAIRCRLLETAGQAGAVRLRCCRPPRRARHVDLHGATLSELRRDDDTVTIDLGACEWAMVELQF